LLVDLFTRVVAERYIIMECPNHTIMKGALRHALAFGRNMNEVWLLRTRAVRGCGSWRVDLRLLVVDVVFCSVSMMAAFSWQKCAG